MTTPSVAAAAAVTSSFSHVHVLVTGQLLHFIPDTKVMSHMVCPAQFHFCIVYYCVHACVGL